MYPAAGDGAAACVSVEFDLGFLSCADHLGTSSIWRSCSALKIAFVFIR
jgi:hypothetical protein